MNSRTLQQSTTLTTLLQHCPRVKREKWTRKTWTSQGKDPERERRKRKRTGKNEKGIIPTVTERCHRIQLNDAKRKMGQVLQNIVKVKVLLILLVPMKKRGRRANQNLQEKKKVIQSKQKRWKRAPLVAKRNQDMIKKKKRKKNETALEGKKKRNIINLQTSTDNEECSSQGEIEMRRYPAVTRNVFSRV